MTELKLRAVGILLDAEASRLPAASAPDALTQFDALVDEALADARDAGYWDAVEGAGWRRHQANTTVNESRAALLAFARERLTAEVTP